MRTHGNANRSTADKSLPRVEDVAKRPLLVYMQGVLPSLHRTERMIAEYILADPERAISSSISDIRTGSGASVGAIVGFCRSLGLRGFANFKIELARELAHGGLSGEAAREQEQSLLQGVFTFHAKNLMETLQINSEDAFQQAAQLLGKARRIEFFSTGISYGVAYTARCKFKLIGLPASSEFDSHLQIIAATHLRPGDVAIGISCSGSTRETVECLKIAKSKHASTICVTNSMKSPITAYADVALFATPSEVKYFQAPMASRVTQLAVIDALFISLIRKRKDKTAKLLHDSGQELLKRRIP